MVLLDLDGVVYAGPSALAGVPERLARVRALGTSLAFVTNNAARTPEEVAAHLRALGVPATSDEVVTSAQAAAGLVAELVPTGAAVLIVGGDGLWRAIEERGLVPVRSAADEPRAVVQGFHPEVNWTQLAEGAYAVAQGVPWVVSNTDRTIPTGRGMAPGNGTLVQVIASATGAEPRASAGKPEPTVFADAVRRGGGQRPLVVGDRLDTDIAGAVAAGYPGFLVLTGVSTFRDALVASAAERPTYFGWDLGALLEPHADPEPVQQLESGGIAVRCGTWTARVHPPAGADPATVRVCNESDTDTPHDGLRAVAMAVWSLPGHDRDAAEAIADAAVAAVDDCARGSGQPAGWLKER